MKKPSKPMMILFGLLAVEVGTVVVDVAKVQQWRGLLGVAVVFLILKACGSVVVAFLTDHKKEDNQDG